MTQAHTDNPMIETDEAVTKEEQVERNRDLLDLIHRRVRDAQVERGKHEAQWDDNNKLAMGAHREVFGASNKNRAYCAVDRIASTISIQMAVMTETPVRPHFAPRETNEPPDWFLKPSGAMKAAEMGVMLTPGQMQGVEVIDDAIVQQLLQMTQPEVTGEQPAPPEDGGGEFGGGGGDGDGGGEGSGEMQPVVENVPVFDEEADFIAVTDKLAAEALSQELASEWDFAHGDEFMRQHIFSSLVVGHRDMMFLWDADEMRGRIVDLYPYNVWIDRWSTTNGDAEYLIVRQVLPMSEARRDHPDIPPEVLEELAGDPESNPFWGGTVGGKYLQSNDREVIDRWTMFQRNVMFDRDPEEAIDMGLVSPLIEQVPVDSIDESGFPTVEMIEQQATDEETGEPVYTLTATGEPTVPGAEDWPKRAGVKQIEMLGDVLLFEGETEFSDVPVARTRNYLIVDSPYGQGEPQRLAPLQELYNRLWTLSREYARHFAQPQKVAPVSVINAMEAEIGRMWSSASETIGIPDEIVYGLQGIENAIKVLDPPQLQPAFTKLLEMIERQMDVIGGTLMVMRGDAKSEWSGETVKSLQNAARGPIGDKSRSLGHAVRHIARVWGNAIIEYLPIEVWKRRNRKYPPQVLQVMKDRIKRVGFDVVAEVSGSGTREQRQDSLTQLVQANPALTQSHTFNRKLIEEFSVNDAEQIAAELREMQMQPQPI